MLSQKMSKQVMTHEIMKVRTESSYLNPIFRKSRSQTSSFKILQIEKWEIYSNIPSVYLLLEHRTFLSLFHILHNPNDKWNRDNVLKEYAEKCHPFCPSSCEALFWEYISCELLQVTPWADVRLLTE